MKSGLIILALCSVLYAETASLIEQAQAAWQDRDKPGQTKKSIDLWEEAVRANPSHVEWQIALAKAMGRAVRHATTLEERRQWADRARNVAEKAIEKDPSNSDAFAVYGEALGQWANAHKGIHSLKAVREAVKALEHAISLNPKNAYAHMLLASFYREAPSVVSVGDKTKALDQAKKAVEFGPGYAINHLVLAKVYLDLDRKKEAIAQLQIIGNLTPPPDAVPETRADQQTAGQLLQDLGVAPAAVPCGQTGGYCSEQDHS